MSDWRQRSDGLLVDGEQYLDVQHHDDPTRHHIGSSLLAPQLVGKVASPVGSIGTSDAPAREDHVHVRESILRVGARIARNVDQGITTAVLTQIVFNTNSGADLEDALGFWDGAGGFIVPAGYAGRYIIDAHLRWENALVSGPIMTIIVNANTPIVRHVSVANAAFQEQAACTTYQLAVGDTVKVFVFHGSGVTRTVSTLPAGGTDPRGPILQLWAIS